MTRWDRIWIDVNLATMDPERGPWGAVEDGALAAAGETVVWVGPRRELPGRPAELAREVVEGDGGWIVPGLLDCHTHLIFAGTRADEYERRLQGATYEEIAREGGGILSTVRATREATPRRLLEDARERAAGLLAEGVTTLEVKSGYGLDRETELRMLRVGRRLAEALDVDVKTTFLGAHALPPEFEGRRESYLDLVVDTLGAARREGLVDMVDAFHEDIAFDDAECTRVFEAATGEGLPVRLHADQLTDGGGAALAARHGALSADHLERTSEDGVRAMAEAGTVAVLLPAAFYFLRDEKPPPVEIFRREGVPMAVATDLNPGSAPARSLLLVVNMATTLFGLTPEEAVAGVTRNAARALGLGDRGVLREGMRADLCHFDVGHPRELAYWIGTTPPRRVWRGGRPRPVVPPDPAG